MNDLYQDLLDEGIENVKIIAIGRSEFSSANGNWIDSNSIPVLVDPLPYNTWLSWNPNQRDLFFLDMNGNYHTHYNISTLNYDEVYNTILELLPSGCTDPNAVNYDQEATIDDESCDYDCNEGYTDIDGQCYYQSDLDVLQQFIDNSQGGTNPPPPNLLPIELGIQEWDESRLISICSSNSVDNDCFMDYQLSGEIPDDIENLTNLGSLSLWDNLLSGIIPGSICSLPNLNDINLGNNQLGGEFPECIWNMISLHAIWIGDNQLQGQLPASVGNLFNLEYLALHNNQLTGEIPNEISNFFIFINFIF